MKKYLYLALLILLFLSMTSCQSSSTSQLEATNQALGNQVNTLMTQLTQQAGSAISVTQEPAKVSTQSFAPRESPLPSPASLPTQETSVIASTLIFSGSGTLTPWSNNKAYQFNLFGSANVHLICDPNDTADGKIWIDNKNEMIGCTPKSESWFPWKQDITIGDHYIYSVNANDKYEFWTIGTTPFTISNRFARSDYMFILNRPGIYNLTANVISGAFNLYLTCEKAQNFNFNITASTTQQLVLSPARCELLIRDSPPGTLTPGEIEVSLDFVK